MTSLTAYNLIIFEPAVMFGTQEIDDCVALRHLNGKGKETK
jgi:hypothetical protein